MGMSHTAAGEPDLHPNAGLILEHEHRPLDTRALVAEHRELPLGPPAPVCARVVGIMIGGASPVAAYVECQASGDEGLVEELRAWGKERMRRASTHTSSNSSTSSSRMVTGEAHRYRLRGLADDAALA